MRNLIKCCRVISIEAWFINYLRSDNFSTRVFFLWLIQTEFYLGAVIKSKKGNFAAIVTLFQKGLINLFYLSSLIFQVMIS